MLGLPSCLSDWSDAANRYEVSGIDVSHYQGAIEWDKLAEDGHDFVFIKATEGKELQDKAFFANWTLAGKTSMRRGAYHFFRPEVTADAQARNFSTLWIFDLVIYLPLSTLKTGGCFPLPSS